MIVIKNVIIILAKTNNQKLCNEVKVKVSLKLKK